MGVWLQVLMWIAGLGVGLGLLSMLPLFGGRRTSHYLSPLEGEPPFAFPEGFLWGSATAAQQIESQQNSNWSAFENEVYAEKRFTHDDAKGAPLPGHIAHLGEVSREILDKKTDHDARIREDVGLMAHMEHNAYRFSISWSRLFPTEDARAPDDAGVQFYTELLDALEEKGIKPSATLFHFSSPAWLWEEREGLRGWERHDALEHFERFVKAVASHFGGRIQHWCTLNEPMVVLYMGYLEGLFPPNEQRGQPVELAELAVRLLEAHVLAYDILKADAKQRGQRIEVGIAKHTRAFEPYRNAAALDRLTSQFAEDAFVWDFLDAMHTGTFRMTATSFSRQIPGLAGSMDYIGINYYGRFYLKASLPNPADFDVLPHDPRDPHELKSDLGWALYPHGFYKVLKKAHERYQKPLYILENGIDLRALDDPLREHFLATHLREVWNAIHHAGADVRGYFYWSLFDNFEWAEGFGPRFGLLHVDYSKNFARTPRKSADFYTQIIRHNGLTQELWERGSPRPK